MKLMVLSLIKGLLSHGLVTMQCSTTMLSKMFVMYEINWLFNT